MTQPTQTTMDLAPSRDVYSVARLNREARATLEGNFGSLWIEGEISNLARPASGHIYFSLKDDAAQVRCAMFRNRNSGLKFVPKDGMLVLLRARVSLYEGRGEFQLIGEHMEPSGEGALRIAFERLKERLDQEGLFQSAHKRPLPTFPRRIGVITSPTGAAIRDILSVLRRRFPGLPVIIYPVPVQGSEAPPAIVRALATAQERAECDVLMLSRGGGSLEDLWAFNDEQVARAIHACELPIIAGIGHEIDFTIADFVADVRAPTPSAGAELLSPDRTELLTTLRGTQTRLSAAIARQLADAGQSLVWLSKRLASPKRHLEQLAQRIDDLSTRLNLAQRGAFQAKHARVNELAAHLQRSNPIDRLGLHSEQTERLRLLLGHAMQRRLSSWSSQVAELTRTLETVGPLATLKRGYAIATTTSGTLVKSVTELNAGTEIHTRLADGTFTSTVSKVEAAD